MLGIHRVTLQRWIALRRIPAPKVKTVAGLVVRGWTAEDIAAAKKAAAESATNTRQSPKRSRGISTRKRLAAL